jgi:hypothetical protein
MRTHRANHFKHGMHAIFAVLNDTSHIRSLRFEVIVCVRVNESRRIQMNATA